MDKKSDIPKATRVAMRSVMGEEEIRKTFMTTKGAAKLGGAKTISESVVKKINGMNARQYAI